MQREEAHLAGRSTALHDQTEAMLSRIHVQGHVGAAGLQAESGQLRSKLAAANDDKRELQASLEREARARVQAQAQLARQQAGAHTPAGGTPGRGGTPSRRAAAAAATAAAAAGGSQYKEPRSAGAGPAADAYAALLRSECGGGGVACGGGSPSLSPPRAQVHAYPKL